jgi:hypothetical protein
MRSPPSEERKEQMRAAGWILLEDYLSLPGESDTAYWQRILDMMPPDQRNSLCGSVAHMGTYKLSSDKILMSEATWKEILAYKP